MGLTIYGGLPSRAFRTVWMAKELGIDYEHAKLNVHTGECNTPEYKSLNPNGFVPTIKDDDFVLWESMAINIYLARKHGGPLAPTSLEDEMRALQWSMWGLTLLDNKGADMIQNARKGPGEKDEGLNDRIKAEIAPALNVLETQLSKHAYLLGDTFTVADLNVAGVFRPLLMFPVGVEAYPKTQAWAKACLERPAAAEAAKA